MEIWKVIPNFSKYEASSLGRLRSLNYKRTGKVKVLKPSVTGGYLKTMLQMDSGKYSSRYVHKFVTITFLGECKSGLEVNHKDGNKLNNSISNLEYVSRSENIKHAYDNNLMNPKVGSLNGMSKLTENDVIFIREHARTNGRYYGRKVLAEKFGVSECTIRDVVTRRRNKFYNV